ncbi:MAG: response regulator transcription factor [bacterium]|nr:response regulator transcription factor [bacterium]
MSSERILTVEDDKHILKLVKYNLEKAGFQCTVTITGEEALEILDKEPVDLIILDIMLPEMDGLQVCKQIKQDKKLSAIPIIMLTAKGEEVDRIVGFELGADDYVVKPFSPRELVLRVKAILKRRKSPEAAKDILDAGKLIVDITRHKVTVDKKEIELTLMEFKLLVTLMQRKGKAQSRDKLLEDIWDIAADVTTRTIDTHIKRLRQKLGKAGKSIETIRGIGYRFSEEEL